MKHLTNEELEWNLRVAFHMSGHAVMGNLQSPGCVRFVALASSDGIFQGVWEADTQVLVKGTHAHFLTSASGIAAEMLVLGAEFNRPYGESVFEEIRLGDDIHDDPYDWTEGRDEPITRELWRELVTEARTKLEAHFDGLGSIAIRLLKAGFVDGSEVRGLMSGCQLNTEP